MEPVSSATGTLGRGIDAAIVTEALSIDNPRKHLAWAMSETTGPRCHLPGLPSVPVVYDTVPLQGMVPLRRDPPERTSDCSLLFGNVGMDYMASSETRTLIAHSWRYVNNMLLANGNLE